MIPKVTHYLVQSRDAIFVKGQGFVSFAENISKNIGNNVSKSLSGKYIQNTIDQAKQSVVDAFKIVSKKSIQATAEQTGELIGNKIANKITEASSTSRQNSSETGTNETENIEQDKEVLKKRNISPIKMHADVDDLKLT